MAKTIRLAVSSKKNEWILNPPEEVKEDVKGILPLGFGVYNRDGRDDAKLMEHIRVITDAVLAAKE